MAQAKLTRLDQADVRESLPARFREGLIIAQAALTVFLLLALLSFDPQDPGWSFTGSHDEVQNLVGETGAWISDVLFFLFGYLAFLFPALLAFQAWRLLLARPAPGTAALIGVRALGIGLALTAAAGLADLHFYTTGPLSEGSGGVLGATLVDPMVPAFSYIGTTLILLSVLLFAFTLATGISWLTLIEATGERALWLRDLAREWLDVWRERRKSKKSVQEKTEARHAALEEHVEKQRLREVIKVEPVPPPAPTSERVAREKQQNLFQMPAVGDLPALHLLDPAENNTGRGYSEEDLDAMSRLLELKLKDYKVDAQVVAVFPGPVVTRFEIQPAAGVKVSRVTGLAKDLARSLAVISVRVVEVIPGKSVIGIEIPNVDRQMVRLSEVLSSKAYDSSSSPLSLVLGHNISGQPVVVDLARMPHLLVAGTTGSGKSVGLNAMILSILFKASPEEVRMIMVDPKMLELNVYEGIPHLLTPVVTDMKDAANALRWSVGEMERRYRLMATMGVRNVTGFNKKVRDARDAGEPLRDPLWVRDELMDAQDALAPELETLPFIVVIVDEFADMIMIVGKKVEELIARIAQKARAAGIHLILATQRPSVDVITGLIKANIPTRIAFQVSSKVDSRTILDQGGAEQLLGHGDMLYLPSGSPIPTRVHGAFVEDDEVHRVVQSWTKLGEPNYLDEILDARSDSDVLPGAGSTDESSDGEQDLLYDEAVQYVLESRRASISSVQRKLRIGYNRAARMIETMEQAGVVSEMNSNGSREVLVNGPVE